MRNLLLLTAIMLTPGLALAIVPSRPVVTEKQIRSATTDTPKPKEATDPEDPQSIFERITESATNAGERLAMKDTGETTQNTQEKLLQDIDRLLNQQNQNNQSSSSQSNSSSSKNNSSNGSPPPSGGNPPSGNPPPNGGNSGSKPPPQGGQNSKTGGRRERPERLGQNPTQPKNGQPQPQSPGPGNKPQPAKPQNDPNNTAQGNPGQPSDSGSMTLPPDVSLTKEIWGHLPEKLRQEVSQYYREQYLPKYNDLLKQYYTTLAERERAKQSK